ncbi:MAG: methyl-accepting chemotaxis protein [Methylococcaceae bacterium]|nr:MAG: methyl-accepting chemotaxis protein [Methylococcaceae bacterium]
MINPHSIGMRLVLLTLAAMLAIGAAGLAFYAHNQRSQTVAAELHRAKAILVMAESVRNQVAGLWERGIYTPALLRGYAALPDKDERIGKILATIPVAVSWSVIMDKAAQGGFAFRVPRAGARNPKNEPDALERVALDYFAAHPEAVEYSLVDPEENRLRYLRPVRIGKECLICHGAPADALPLWGRDDGHDILGYRMDGKKIGDLHGAFEILVSLDGSDAALYRQLGWGILWVVLAIILILVTVYQGTSRVIVQPLTELALRLQDIAQGEGDLTARLKVPNTKNEFAWISHNFNRFVKKIHTVVDDLRGSSHALFDSARQLSAISDTTENGMSRQRDQLNQAAATIIQTATLAKSIADDTRSAVVATGQSAGAVVEGKRLIEGGVNVSITHLAAEIGMAAEVIRNLESDSQRIGQVLTVIQDIAEQTNLLALNAAIEAARAGEQGRGFAVVADEVRQLANRTRKSTDDIRTTIEQLLRRTREAAQVMEQGALQATQTVDHAHAAANALNDISASVDTIGNVTQQIANAAAEQNRMSEEVSHRIEGACTVSHETMGGMQRITQEIQRVAQLAERLESMVNQFRT